MPIIFRSRELIEQLTSAQVRFVVVGGIAVGAWGHIRGTRDLDIVPDPDLENLERLSAALVGLDGRVKVGERLTTSDSIPIFLKAGDKTLVATRLGDVDVLQGLPQIPSYEELASHSVTIDLDGIKVEVCSLEHLLAMKRAADRPLDRIDIEALEMGHGKPTEDE